MTPDNMEITHKLRHLFLLWRMLHQQAACDLPIHPGQLPLLEYVRRNSGCTQTELAGRLMVSPASVAQSTKRMEKAGLLTKQSGDSLRSKRLELTAFGEEVCRNSHRTLQKADGALLGGLTPQELEALSAALDRILQNMEENLPGPPGRRSRFAGGDPWDMARPCPIHRSEEETNDA